MKNFIFVTDEGITFQPNSKSITPDIENLQVIGFSTGLDPNDAFNNLLKNNSHLRETTFSEIRCYELVNKEVKGVFNIDA